MVPKHINKLRISASVSMYRSTFLVVKGEKEAKGTFEIAD